MFICNMTMHRLREYYEKRKWDIYLAKYPHMTKKTFEQYDYTKKRKIKNSFSQKSGDELLARAERTKKKFGIARLKRGGTNRTV